MPVQPREDVSSSSTTRRPTKLQGSMSQNGTRHRPAPTSKSLLPSGVLQLNTIPQKAELQTIRDGPRPTAAKPSQVFSLPRLGTNANKSREIIPVIPSQCDGIVVSSRRKRLVRHPSRRLSTPAQTSSSQHATPFTGTLPRPPSLCMADKAPKNLTKKTSFSPLISIGDETDEDSDDPTARHRKERRLQMARLAKLTRYLGEEIPPELILSSTLPTDIAEFRSLAGSLSVNPSKGHQRRWSLDPTADPQSAPVLPSSSKLRKSRSLRGTEGILRPQTHGEHVVNVVDGKLPCVSHPPRTEANFPEPSQYSVSASLRGPDDVNHSLMSTSDPYGLQSPSHTPPPIMSLASTPERSQLHENSVTSELALNNIVNVERREEKLSGFLGVDTNPGLRSLTNRSLHPTGDLAVGIRPSLAQTPSYSELEVGVQISRRARFWRMKVGKDVVQSVNPDDIAMQLREMKAST